MGRYPIEQTTALGYLSSPLRRPSVIEKWNPYEIALFEGALAYHGKLFNLISKHYVTTKSTKEIIEFYYIWKKTSHGRRWKIALLEQGGGIGGGGGGGSAGVDCWVVVVVVIAVVMRRRRRRGMIRKRWMGRKKRTVWISRVALAS